MTADGGATSDDAALGGRLMLRQPRRGHRFGHDSILLAAATLAHAG
ncbi:MAG: methyltransferase, partial [Xanthobacteraceae bacterium]